MRMVLVSIGLLHDGHVLPVTLGRTVSQFVQTGVGALGMRTFFWLSSF